MSEHGVPIGPGPWQPTPGFLSSLLGRKPRPERDSASAAGVEGSFEMAQPPGSLVPAALADDHVEARAPGSLRLFAQPGRRAAHESQSLARVHGVFARARAARAPGLHLHEHDECAAPDDQVHLDAAGPDVAGDDAITSRGQMLGGASLAFCAELLAAASPRRAGL